MIFREMISCQIGVIIAKDLQSMNIIRGKFIMKSSGVLVRVFLICLLGISFSNVLSACTLSAWESNSGAVISQDPNNMVPRMNGNCGLEVSAIGYVEDDSPSAEASFVGHFYFLPEFSGSGSVDIFVAYSDEAGNTPRYCYPFRWQ